MMRIFAVIAAESLGVIGAGSLVGIEVWQAAVLAGALGAARVLEALARFYLPNRWKPVIRRNQRSLC
jgi:hypothetical protein